MKTPINHFLAMKNDLPASGLIYRVEKDIDVMVGIIWVMSSMVNPTDPMTIDRNVFVRIQRYGSEALIFRGAEFNREFVTG
jgi:hypothetical protein